MTTDNIATLFAPDPSKPAGAVLGQGIVQSWNPDTGENEILFAGGTLANIPSLTSEAANLVAGDTVALAVSGDRMLVLGKVTTPGDPGTVPTWNADITALDDQVQPLVPLTALAAQTDGTTMTGIGVVDSTVTGSLIRTAVSGKRWEMDSANHANQLRGYSGEANESAPGLVEVDSFQDLASTLIGAPDLGGTPAVLGPYLYLTSDKTDPADPSAYSYLNSDFLYLQGRKDSTFGVLVDCSAAGVSFDTTALGTAGPINLKAGSGGVAITTAGPVTVNGKGVVTADTFKGGRATVNTNASGIGTVTHGMGATPAFVVVTTESTGTYWAAITARSSTTFTVQINSKDAGVLVSGSINIDWFASL